MPKKRKRRTIRHSRPYEPRAHLSPAIRPKLSPEQVREIRKAYKFADKIQKARGLSKAPPGLAQRLAIKYGVSPATIFHIRKGERWSTLK